MTHPALWVVKEVTDNHRYDAARGKRVARGALSPWLSPWCVNAVQPRTAPARAGRCRHRAAQRARAECGRRQRHCEGADSDERAVPAG